MRSVRDLEKMPPRLQLAYKEHVNAEAELRKEERKAQKRCKHKIILFRKTVMHDMWNERPQRICIRCRLYELGCEWSSGNRWWLWNADDNAPTVTGQLKDDPWRTVIETEEDLLNWKLP